jgi:hypothetical protein
VLVLALLANKLWAYPWMIAFLIIFIGYQLYRIALTPTAWLIWLTIFDAFVCLGDVAGVAQTASRPPSRLNMLDASWSSGGAGSRATPSA